jgi:hypothetical protein
MTAKKATATAKSQSQKDKFMATVRELGGASEAAFNRVLKRVGKAPVPDKSAKKAKRNG